MKPPLANSYWVEPGRLLAGEHPEGRGGGGTRARVDSILSAGVRSFIDLTQPNESESYRNLLPVGVAYTNFPIRDHSVPESVQLMRDILSALEVGMRGGAVYLHCRAGIGRTGLAVGCYLRERGETPHGALIRLNILWRQNARSASWPTVPETDEQERYVRNWIGGEVQAQQLLRYRSCLVSLAVGDALASAPAEVSGQLGWADDAAMAMCVAESLVACRGVDVRDQLQRFRSWADCPAAAGASSSAALRPAVRSVLHRALWNRSAVMGTHDPDCKDPSPLARAAACALYSGGQPMLAARLAAECARVTHHAPVLVDSCRLLAGLISQALAGHSRERIMLAPVDTEGGPLREEVRAVSSDWLEQKARRRRPPAAVLGVLDRAVRCFVRSRTFSGGLERALASPGSDRDTICAVYGALAGAFYGADAVGPELRARIAGLERVERIAEQVFKHRVPAHESAV